MSTPSTPPTTPISQKPDMRYLTHLSVFASLAVVYLHFNGVFWQHPTGWTWITANIIEATCYFAVPIFFMISGCTLIDYRDRYSTINFFRKRIKKTLLPFLFWSTIACLYEMLRHPNHYQGLSLSDFFWRILEAKDMPVYWFFMPLFTLYLTFPLLSAIKQKREVFSYLLLLAFFLMTLPSTLAGFGLSFLPQGLSFPLSSGYVIYPILGYLLHHTILSPKWRWAIICLGGISLLTNIIVTTLCSPVGSPICMLLKGYTKLPAVLQACAVFIFVKDILAPRLVTPTPQQIIAFFAPATFAIYLLHMYAHYIFTAFIQPSSFIYRLFFPIFAFILLTCLVRPLQRWVPFLLPR